MYTIKIVNKVDRYMVRIELQNRLIILIDIYRSYDALPSSFLKSCFANTIVDNEVKVLNQSYEYFFRKIDLNLNTSKKIILHLLRR